MGVGSHMIAGARACSTFTTDYCLRPTIKTNRHYAGALGGRGSFHPIYHDLPSAVLRSLGRTSTSMTASLGSSFGPLRMERSWSSEGHASTLVVRE
jgi:hypothetical protein